MFLFEGKFYFPAGAEAYRFEIKLFSKRKIIQGVTHDASKTARPHHSIHPCRMWRWR